VTGEYYLWYIPALLDAPVAPLGVYSTPAPAGPIHSVEIGDGSIPRFLQHATSWSKYVSDILGTPYKFLHYLDDHL
jgi:hypothetical protein